MTAAVASIHAHALDHRIPSPVVQGTEDRVADPESSHAFYERVTSPDKELKVYDGG